MHDDLIGTQTPERRITDPEEALRLLEQVLPDLAAHRRPQPAPIDWTLVEGRLGTGLPTDYKRLAEYYPSFALSHEYLGVGLPSPGSELELDGTTEALEIVHDWYEDDMSIGLQPHPAPGGLLPWTSSVEGDLFLWITAGSTPDDWPVTVATRGGEWWHYAGGAVQFLAELASGTIEPWGLSRIDADVTVYEEGD
ncbi:SMI1/KNR4 family protein [Streptomyces sp. HNM0663]|uniref:SMI1/KNR4 family protein n=1 Tax=Streptomyces chengmaiensis TaxID=3040919 RepID=A0ABT6HXJ5_9ACTN|nr:SMI1/KNR4 family protein [Streptomyces chengmaiensis]MDH2393427.1 SMI1/KNR4 family protein [Streptomyces chengmaiensis]